MEFINENDPFSPVIVIDDSEGSKQAIQELKEANIKFKVWPVEEVGQCGKPPYVIRGRNKYLGLEGIREFLEIYPEMLRLENETIRLKEVD